MCCQWFTHQQRLLCFSLSLTGLCIAGEGFSWNFTWLKREGLNHPSTKMFAGTREESIQTLPDLGQNANLGLGWKEKDIQEAWQVLIPDKGFFFQAGIYILCIYSNINSSRGIRTWMLAPKSFPIRYSVLRLQKFSIWQHQSRMALIFLMDTYQLEILFEKNHFKYNRPR